MKTTELWREMFRRKRFAAGFVSSSLALIAALLLFSNFLQFVEARQGVQLNDPILNCFKAMDFTWATFIIIYGCLIVAVYLLLKSPEKFLLSIQAYTAMTILRAAAMYLLPLEPPPGMIILSDPFVEFFGSGQTLTKDLFFSGHMATMFLFFLIFDGRTKLFFLAGTIIIALFVLLQHVHYSIDVFCAPFFAWGACRAAGKIYYYSVEDEGI